MEFTVRLVGIQSTLQTLGWMIASQTFRLESHNGDAQQCILYPLITGQRDAEAYAGPPAHLVQLNVHSFPEEEIGKLASGTSCAFKGNAESLCRKTHHCSKDMKVDHECPDLSIQCELDVIVNIWAHRKFDY